VAFVVVRHRLSAARLHRQPRRGAVERLDLAPSHSEMERSASIGFSWNATVGREECIQPTLTSCPIPPAPLVRCWHRAVFNGA
jgi:hypothetical protein